MTDVLRGRQRPTPPGPAAEPPSVVLHGALAYLECRLHTAQDAGDQSQVEDGDVTLAALDGADEGSVQAALSGQLRLRQLPGQPQLAEAVAQPLKELLVG